MAPGYYSDVMNLPTVVYRFYDASGRLLYVGLTMNLTGRLAAHRRKKWWPDIHATVVEHFDNREIAKSEEAKAIRSENPLYNIIQPRGLQRGLVQR